MKCSQMTELMQRSLDHDLTESEQQTMVSHFHQCPECASFFERLQLVSDELEALPAVMPPFSIVDSILHRLDETIPDPGLTVPKEAPAIVPAPVRKRRFKPAWFGYGGAAAAAILLGAFIFQAGDAWFGNAKNADSSMESASVSAQDQAANTVSPTVTSTEAGGAAGQTSLKKDTAAPEAAYTPMNDVLTAPDNEFTPYHTDRTPTSDESEESVRKYALEDSGKDSIAQIFGGEEDGDQNKGLVAPSTTPAPAGNAVVPGVILPPAKNEASEPASTVSPEAVENGGVTGTGGGGAFPGSAADSEQTLSSVSGKYNATIENQKVIVRDEEQMSAMESGFVWGAKDKVSLTLWYNDYQLMYTVTKEDGTQEKYIMDLLGREEFLR